ncbi:MAG TPA: hypothetical protein VM582_00135 [Candidatus Thermoplasmatota archaeon]|nr:hypothetical protein [Candidatus Thermoplasmatota archaeon]
MAPSASLGGHRIHIRSRHRPLAAALLALGVLLALAPPVAAEDDVGAASHNCDPHNVSVDGAHAPAGAWSNHNHPRFFWSTSGTVTSCLDIDAYEVWRSWTGTSVVFGTDSSSYDYHVTVPDGAGLYVQVRASYCHLHWNGCHYHWTGWYASASVSIDTGLPSVAIATSGHVFAGATRFVGPSTTFTLSASDSLSGVARIEWRLDNGAWGLYGGAFSIATSDGPHTVEYRAIDRAGNVRTASLAVVFDGTPPAVGVSVADDVVDGGARFVSSRSTFSLAAHDAGVGVASLDHRIDGGAWTPHAAPFSIEGADGAHAFSWRVADRLGNAASGGGSVVLDNAAPAIQTVRPLVNSASVGAHALETCGGDPRATENGEEIASVPLGELGLPDPAGLHPAINSGPRPCEGVLLATNDVVVSPPPSPPGVPDLEVEETVPAQRADHPTFIVTAGEVQIEALIEDALVGTAFAELVVDGEVVDALAQGDGAYVFAWDAGAATPGEHVVSVRATDRLGNVGERTFLVLVVSATPPPVEESALP